MKTPLQAIEHAKTFSTLDTAALIMVAEHVAVELRRVVAWLRATPTDKGGADRLTAASRAEGLAAQLQAGMVHRPADVVLTKYMEMILDDHPIGNGGAA